MRRDDRLRAASAPRSITLRPLPVSAATIFSIRKRIAARRSSTTHAETAHISSWPPRRVSMSMKSNSPSRANTHTHTRTRRRWTLSSPSCDAPFSLHCHPASSTRGGPCVECGCRCGRAALVGGPQCVRGCNGARIGRLASGVGCRLPTRDCVSRAQQRTGAQSFAPSSADAPSLCAHMR